MGATSPVLSELLARLRKETGSDGAPRAAALLGEALAVAAGDDAMLRLEPAPETEAPVAVDDLLELIAEGRLDRAWEAGADPEGFAGLGERLTALLDGADENTRTVVAPRARAWLDAVRRPVLLRRAAEDDTARWMDLILRVVDASRFTVARLFEQRVERYGPRTLFKVGVRGRDVDHSWLEVSAQVDRLARGFLALSEEHGHSPVAILSENRYEMALVDLACLTTGVVDLMIPATATEADVAYILGRSKAAVIVVSGEAQRAKVEAHRAELPALATVVSLDPPRADTPEVLSLAAVAERGRAVSRDRLAAARDAIDPRAVATLMYTSGTTGHPKGIRFSQRNIVSKRYARALALPEIGDQDVFLCFLPLFHTFGRYFEMMGTIFWGAVYAFLEDPSLETLRASMRRIRPTVFISIPKKWIQLWEEIGRRADLESDPDERLREATREVVGDRLRWGLSAAGYLDPEIFRFFQRQGVELMSGFGMTEATGGITMTPPGAYRDDTLGVPLPGIEVKLDEQGEMLMRGPYVMMGYLDADEGTGVDADGWVRTGDLMVRDEAGYYRLVDRKKEIYKNIKGESVAPQRVENLFRDFEAVKRVFLVGDHKPYNTVLIVPNPDAEDLDLEAMDYRDQRDYFRSLVVSVNRFLAPFERIVDFAVVDRDFDEERGELTPKGTYRRKTVADNFAPVIERLYRRLHLKSPELGIAINVPNWLFQALGLTAGDVRLEGERLELASSGASLTVRRLESDDDGGIYRIGSHRYRVRGRVVDLGALLSSPPLWLGNEELSAFATLEPRARIRRIRAPRELTLLGRAVRYRPGPAEVDRIHEAARRAAPSLEDLDLAARAVGSDREDVGLPALEVVGRALRGEEEVLQEGALTILRLVSESASAPLRRRAFQILLPAEKDQFTPVTLHRFLAGPEVLLDDPTIAVLSEKGLSESKLDALVRHVHEIAEREAGPGDQGPAAASVLRLLAEYGAAHPVRYKGLRWALARVEAFTGDAGLREQAGRSLERLTTGFRAFIGPVQRIAVDPEEGEEYRWEDVITFEDGIDADDRERIGEAIARTSLLREAVFLFSGGTLLGLANMPPGGIWVSLLGRKHGKSVYRVTAHTRLQGSFDLALNLNRDQSPAELAGEMRWLQVAGGAETDGPLVETFGGYWPAYDLWSEEFIAGETLDRVVARLSRRREDDPVDRLRLLWPFFVWSTAGAFVEFWMRTGRRFVLAEPSPGDVIVPTHDYQTGTRVVSISDRAPAPGVGEMLDDLWRHAVVPMEERYPDLAGAAPPEVIVSAFLETVGVGPGLELLRAVSRREGPVTSLLEAKVERVERDGFVPRRLRSAVDRYHRWAALAPDAPPPAHAQTVRELFDTYRLHDLLREYPDARVRFFRDTVFRDAPDALAHALDDILGRLRRRELDGDQLVERLTALRVHMEPGSPEEYFLARLTYPHLMPGDEAGFLSTEMGGVRQTDIVVSLEDNQGRPYTVRQPVNPKEVGRLHRLFLGAKLDVQFRPEHQFLVAVNERGAIIGGIFYEMDEDGSSAYLEKIVVGERYRKLGVGDGLMNEFFNRLRAAGASTATTGFFRPSYFYRFGFSVEKRQAGLVKSL